MDLAHRPRRQRRSVPRTTEGRAGRARGASPMTRAYLSLGSNLAERTDHLRAALGALSRAPWTELTGISGIYETQAVEVEEEQPDYLNCVVGVECDLLAAVELLRLCQGIEVALGRDRGEAGENAPRTVDIDVLLFGEEVVDGWDFRVPHRGISRAYNLVGLADLDPSMCIPGSAP